MAKKEISVSAINKHNDELRSISKFSTIPDGAIFTKKDDTTLEFGTILELEDVTPIADGVHDYVLGAIGTLSVTTKNGRITAISFTAA